MGYRRLIQLRDVVMAGRDSKSFVTRTRDRLPRMHPAERRLADFVLDFPGELASDSALDRAGRRPGLADQGDSRNAAGAGAPACRLRTQECDASPPLLRELEDGRAAACIHVGEERR